jgi:hypothetical protein
MKADVDQKSAGLKPDLTDRSSSARSAVGASIVRSRLFIKYTILFVAVVVLALLANGGFEIWFSYQEHKGSLISIQQQQALAAADKIEEFITQIESQWAGPRSCRGPTVRSISAASMRCASCVRSRPSPSLHKSMRRVTSNLKSRG